MIVPTLCVGMPRWTLGVRSWDAARPGMHPHAARGNDQVSNVLAIAFRVKEHRRHNLRFDHAAIGLR
ncbi:hypothetical protein C9383_16210 [Pseudomonas palleroniana]|uniref:Uncharacterized protein n=1 Tax=Pseudomonas palleroniana TaxID=191390 RepID=A0A2T4FQD7_9PSED|nr:hypothetical protein C9383_16210 [Pseudomonas palleroniana]